MRAGEGKVWKARGSLLCSLLIPDYFNFISLGRRVAAFGYHAGFAGAAIGLDVWCQQQIDPARELGDIKPYPNEQELIDHARRRLEVAGRWFAGCLCGRS